MKKSSPESIKNTREEIAEWASEHKRLQTLLPIEAARNKLRDQEIPELEKQIKDTDASLSQLADSAEEVRMVA
jgi:DNA repair protein RAD50